jgi:hypothetical protein
LQICTYNKLSFLIYVFCDHIVNGHKTVGVGKVPFNGRAFLEFVSFLTTCFMIRSCPNKHKIVTLYWHEQYKEIGRFLEQEHNVIKLILPSFCKELPIIFSYSSLKILNFKEFF